MRVSRSAGLLIVGFFTALAQGATAPPVSQSAIAPALALGDAYAAIVEQSKGAVVSVFPRK